ncbi:hypothetical protein D1823_19815 (plasmid) [Ruegeria sp. AD91A]|nr:hypothetical protein D1823_19815 [Ruegeria sp. AD91A]
MILGAVWSDRESACDVANLRLGDLKLIEDLHVFDRYLHRQVRPPMLRHRSRDSVELFATCRLREIALAIDFLARAKNM